MRDYYQILGVSQKASLQEIESAYRSLSSECDPNAPALARNRIKWVEASHRLTEVKRAFAVLSDAPRRAEYDRRLLGENQLIPPPLPLPGTSDDAWTTPRPGPKGVGGFLKLFCVILTGVIPPLWLFAMLLEWLEAAVVDGSKNDDLIAFAGMLIITQILRTALVIYGVAVGVQILSGNDRGRFIAKQFLLQAGLGGVLLQIWAYMLFRGTNRPSIPVTAGEFMGALAVGFSFFVWFVYFDISKRVRNTYGPEHHRAVMSIEAHRERRIAELRRRDICVVCGYDMRATPYRCPECGTVVPPETGIHFEFPQPPPR